jgi:hypothetical protein
MPRPSPRIRLLVLVLVISTVVGAIAAKVNTRGTLQVATAATHVLVDYPEPSIVYRRALQQDLNTLQSRAELYGRMLVTAPVLKTVAARAGIPQEDLAGIARTTGGVTVALMQPDSEERASQLDNPDARYRLEIQPDWQRPTFAIYAQAPSTEEAERLGDASVQGLRDFLANLARQQGYPAADLPQIRQLGATRGSVVNGKAVPVIAGLTFLLAFFLTAVALLAGARFLSGSGPPSRAPSTLRRAWDSEDAWPRTTRLLPWSLAGFITVLWLTPFDRIQLGIQTPIDMKLDRLLLPLVVAVVLLAFAAGPRVAPRLRLTPIHVAIGAFVTVAFLSVVIGARGLNQTLEFEVALKKLPLLVSYVSVFAIMAASIRPGEVRAFMTLTMVLGIICGLGLIWQYRFDTNLFTLVTDKVLPGIFQMQLDMSAAVDSAGRRGVTGPAAVGLEAVAMLSFALSIVIVRMLGTREARQRALYGLAACIILAATFATARKSALLAPASVVVTLAYFRRRELLAMAPIGLVICVAVAVLSPGAVRGTFAQLTASDRSTVATTSDRIADYDAVRPDFWMSPLFGRGHGSYGHETYRLLDSEILTRLLETGVVGLLAFLGMGVAVVLASRRTIADRDPTWAPHALVGAACAVCFLVMSTLFDLLSFPHATYLFFYIAGLVAAVLARDREPLPSTAAEDELLPRAASAPVRARPEPRMEITSPTAR